MRQTRLLMTWLAGGLPMLELRPPTLGWVQFQAKRAFDLVVGADGRTVSTVTVRVRGDEYSAPS